MENMLTLLSTCKPFRDHIGVIQKNAIRSWTLLEPRPEIILFGDEEGTETMAEELHLHHIPEVERNEYGTPLMSSIVKRGQKTANGRFVCYINADIILMSDFVTAVSQLVKWMEGKNFLLVGKKWDIDSECLVSFEDKDWEAKLRKILETSSPRPDAFEYFLFPKKVDWDMPPFSVRPFFDNWFIYKARRMKIPVIDGSDVISVVHQRHDHSHYLRDGEVALESPEVRRNLQLLGFWHKYTLSHATHEFTADGLKERRKVLCSIVEQLRMIEIYIFYLLRRRFYPYSYPIYIALRGVKYGLMQVFNFIRTLPSLVIKG